MQQLKTYLDHTNGVFHSTKFGTAGFISNWTANHSESNILFSSYKMKLMTHSLHTYQASLLTDY